MSLFKKKKSKKTNVTVNKASDVITTRSDELKIEMTGRDYVIFSDASSMYLCFDNDFDNPITFESYEESIQRTLILRKGDVLALLYFNNASNKFEVTDFIFTSIKTEKHSLLLTTSDNKKHFYCYHAIYNDICDYVPYDLEDGFELVLIKFHDHDELYKRYFTLRLELLFSAKNIELCTTLKFNENLSSNWKTIFKYTEYDSDFMDYFIVDNGYLEKYESENNHTLLDIVNYCKDNAAIIGTSKNGKKCVFNMYSPDEVSKYYDSILSVGKLFLCMDGNHIEIIDISFNIYYENDYEDAINISLSYDEKDDIYVLRNNDSKILSLHLYNIYCEDFYSIFKADEEYGTLYNFEPEFCIPNFITIHENDIFEFKDEYFASISNYYAFFEKGAVIGNKDDFCLNSKYVKTLFYYNESENETFDLNSSEISILKKCNVSAIKNVYKSDDVSIVIEAYNSICNITIVEDVIEVKVATGENMELDVSDIKTNLIDYIFEHINNKFSTTYLKYLLK